MQAIDRIERHLNFFPPRTGWVEIRQHLWFGRVPDGQQISKKTKARKRARAKARVAAQPVAIHATGQSGAEVLQNLARRFDEACGSKSLRRVLVKALGSTLRNHIPTGAGAALIQL